MYYREYYRKFKYLNVLKKYKTNAILCSINPQTWDSLIESDQ